MKFMELKNLGVLELKKRLEELKDETHSLSVKKRLNQLKNTHKLKLLKKDIARVLTALHGKK
ncbi:MAG: 50S ribosomal protein L29 [Candidatus Doudnabacteria bacterium CG10_big_fil_rev_8_21_14_0_10_42_18]|uniref:Large ribosomal subunit protein uL29 n=1 Tax=Candidatus Doudnabacteria bacterium CG10_big_fil_rev_8_21_14_0_10_42_18 TaxID=1974552 RepID=A0A2H0VBH8_9BACT|nr:MAG: 50S ribosomal protein L29 [Candidatus Doudnabacteria bacterium CG10_big_fil_rev_8_21_14_0_10_42_18]